MISGQLQSTSVRCTLFVIGFVVYLICFPAHLQAQRQIGVHWNVPDDINRASQELELFNRLGLSHLEVDEQLPEPVWDKIDSLGFKVFGQLPVRFAIPQTFAEPDPAFLTAVTDLITHYTRQPSVQAIGLFQYGLTQEERFSEALKPYIQQIQKVFPGKLYYLAIQTSSASSDRQFSFNTIGVEIDRISANRRLQRTGANDTVAYYYNPREEFRSRLTPVKDFLKATSGSQQTVFFSSDWLLNIRDIYPGFYKTLRLFTGESKPVFAAPQERLPASYPHAPIVILLVVIWGVFALNYSFSPVFRRSLSRYFIGHRFYVEDIMKRHIRSMGPAAILLLLHAMLAGIVIYCLLSVNFSDLGIRALAAHIPFSIGGENFLISAVIGMILLSLAAEGLSVLWLRLINPGIRQLAQVVNLYVWPLLLNLYLATAIVTLMMAGYGSAIITVLGILFFLIFYATFLITSVDTGRYIRKRRWLLTVTNIIYLLMLAAIVVQIISSPYLLDVFRLGLWLS